ncbi:DUF742 domain-containing protein [Nocardia neocaledoniensis]|uniref:DUF742 domain-containing protein n=1 Tax=Nocardia neocaledoniensis TaxID=236511 RepID=UPI002455ECE0|nr:DUF742 domain-containing protein [Nocardia neocaledoniensis]
MNDDEGELSSSEDPGPLVRPFAVTRGRVGKDLYDLDILTVVVAVRPAAEVVFLDREYGEILRLCQARPQSIVEIAAHLDLMVVATKVLISDLIKSGHVIFRPPPRYEGGHDPALIQAVLDGLREL